MTVVQDFGDYRCSFAANRDSEPRTAAGSDANRQPVGNFYSRKVREYINRCSRYGVVMSSQRPADSESDDFTSTVPDGESESSTSPVPDDERDGPPSSPDVGDLTVDDLFELLASPGNRFVIAYLLERDEAVPWYDMVEHVVDQTDPPMDLSKAAFRGRISTQIISRCLPDLAEAGLVRYEEGRYHVHPTEKLELARAHLDIAREQFPTSREGLLADD